MSSSADRCAEFRALASARLDGELDELQGARLEHHLSACGACASWGREIAALTGMLREAEPQLLAQPSWTLVGRARSVRRFVRATAVGATAASAAAVAALAIAHLGSGMPFFSSNGTQISSAPCVSCTKLLALTTGGPPSTPAHAPIHVANPLLRPE